MSETPLKDALNKLPTQQIEVGVVATPEDVGVKGEANVDIGKPGGWSWLASAEWWREKGWQAATWFRWTGKS
jgi:hypothetical protein